jgi:hypothetical protein
MTLALIGLLLSLPLAWGMGRATANQLLLVRGCLSVLNGTVPTECHCYRMRAWCEFQMNKFA